MLFPMQGREKDVPLFQFTKKPIYITGAAPGGVYWLRISSKTEKSIKGKVELYNAYPENTPVDRKDKDLIKGIGWVDISQTGGKE